MPPAALNHDYLPALTGLRGVASAWVAAFHAWQFAGQPAFAASTLLAVGYFGVDLFFVLSGLLLGLPFARACHARRRLRLWPFWRNRLCRVLPALWVQVLVLLAAAAWMGKAFAGWREIGGHLSLSFNLWRNDSVINPVHWSLPVEWDFYLLLPVLALLYRRRAGLWAGALAALVLSIGVRVACVAALQLGGEEGIDAYRWIIQLPARLDQFFAGMIVAGCLAGGARRGAAWAAGAGIALVALAAWAAAGHADIVVEVATPWLYVHFSVLAAGFAGLAYAAAVAPGSIGSRLLSGRPLAFLGMISYSLYLWHYPVLSAMSALAGGALGAPLATLLALPLVVAISWASYRWVERPFLGQRARRAESHVASGPAQLAQASASE